MKVRMEGKARFVAAGAASAALVFGWLGVAGALPSIVTQPITAIEDVVTDPSTSVPVGADDTTTTAPGDVTTSVPAASTTTAPGSSTSTTLADDDDDDDAGDVDDACGPSSRNCGRYQAGPDCARPVQPGYERHDDDDDDDDDEVVVSSTTASERSREKNRGKRGDDD